MSRTQRTAQGGPGDARVTEERHLTGQDREDEVEGTDDRGRRWYHLRPEPRRRTDLMGFNSTWWMALGWAVLIVLAVVPIPWW